MENHRVGTKYISEINFVSSASPDDIIELGILATHFGNTSIILTCEVRNKMTYKKIIHIDKIAFVNLDRDGNSAEHGKTKIEYVKDRMKGTIEGELPS